MSIPISGTPASLGELVCSIVFKMDGKELFKGDITAAVSSTNEIFSESFDLSFGEAIMIRTRQE